ncbi:hypothetical protein F4X33_21645, partial [Candidatus Poribacteria bacterium]|nr:hypothetical protein [Candidatus Poribacteria bacterium]
VSASADAASDANESVLLGFGALPPAVTEGTNGQAVVTILDVAPAPTDVAPPSADVAPPPPTLVAVTVHFEQASYTVGEGSSAEVRVQLNQDPDRTVVIPITEMGQGGATEDDYSGVPASLTFNAGETEKTITVSASADAASDANESVLLGFGSLPQAVTEGANDQAVVTILDVAPAPTDVAPPPADVVPPPTDVAPTPSLVPVTVQFERASYTVGEGSSAEVRVHLNQDPDRRVVIPITGMGQGGATEDDYSGVPGSLTFSAGETEKTITVSATADAASDGNESILLGFGALPQRVAEGTNAQAVVTITNVPAVTVQFNRTSHAVPVTVQFEQASYTVDEGSSAEVRVQLNQDPDRTVVIPITETGQGGATEDDYSGVPGSLTFDAGETEKAITVSATADAASDANESVLLGFGPLPQGVTEGTNGQAVVKVSDVPAPVPAATPTPAPTTAETVGTGGGSFRLLWLILIPVGVAALLVVTLYVRRGRR